jgi:hypothetical protein
LKSSSNRTIFGFGYGVITNLDKGVNEMPEDVSKPPLAGANPITAADALKLWDAGEAVPAFQVEAKPERQAIVYAAAFDVLRGEDHDHSHLSERERDVAESIAVVAKKEGWGKMVATHIHAVSPAISVSRPASDQENDKPKDDEEKK